MKAIYNFNGENDDELSIKKGDVIEVVEIIDDGWWIGNLKGKIGMFPANYVESMNVPVASPPVSTSPPSYADISNEPSKKEEITRTEEKPKSNNTQNKFSYMPANLASTAVNLKSSRENIHQELPKKEVSASVQACGDCGCNEYSPNVFKKGQCNNCFHKH